MIQRGLDEGREQRVAVPGRGLEFRVELHAHVPGVHGARQLDNAPSPLHVLPAIREAVGDRMTVMFDGGIRRGLDALIAICMGAKFVFQGRPTLYGVTAGGTAGAAKALGVSEADVIASLEAGDLKGKRIGTQWRITKTALAEFLK